MKILIVYNSEKYGGDTTAYQCAEILNSSDVQTSIIKFDTRVTREIPCAGSEKCFGLLKRSVPDSGICTSHRFCSHHPPGKN